MKRATLRYRQFFRQRKHFNPRPREEGDTVFLQEHYADDHFNPRPREEGDKQKSCEVFMKKNFNPRPREEGDLSGL